MSNRLINRKLKYLKSVFSFLPVLIAFSSCGGKLQPSKLSPPTNEKKEIINAAVIKLDTATFLSGKDAINLLSFDESGLLKINQENISLNLIDATNGYDLSVTRLDKTIFSKQVQGVSKVLYIKDWLLFTLYTSFSEDGANEGQAIIMNVKNGTVQIFGKALHNTCNPAIINKKLYLINGLQLIEADLNLNIKRTLPISYFSSDDPYSYLDTYLICGLSLNNDKNLLSIEFTSVKSDNTCKFYSGIIEGKDKAVLLKEQ